MCSAKDASSRPAWCVLLSPRLDDEILAYVATFSVPRLYPPRVIQALGPGSNGTNEPGKFATYGGGMCEAGALTSERPRLTPRTAALIGETPAEWQWHEKQVRAGRSMSGTQAD